MEENHYIEWIEVFANCKIYRKFLKPRDKPEAEFDIKAERIEAREHCKPSRALEISLALLFNCLNAHILNRKKNASLKEKFNRYKAPLQR